MSNLKTSIIIDIVDRTSAPIRRITRSLGEIRRVASPAVADVSKKFSNATREVGALAGKLAILGGAGAWVIKSQLIDTAAQFERFRTILETIEGSSEKAKASMDWVSTFAAKTPYELSEVMDAFVKLRAYGLNPTSGLLKTLGDTSAAMGKPLIQAVEAMADAVTGEYERLKEYGIKGSTKGNKASFMFRDSKGIQQIKTVDKNNSAMIESTIASILNERYAGGMDKLSKTWDGMMSNLSDQWSRFTNKIMAAGLFDWMQTKLSGLLNMLDRMASNGDLDRIATLWGKKLKSGMEEAWRIGTQLWAGFKQIKRVVDSLANALGGYDKLLMVVAATMAVKAVASVVALSASLVNLGAVVLPALGLSFTSAGTAGTASLTAMNTSATGLLATLQAILVPLGIIAALGGVLFVVAEGAEKTAKMITDKQVKGMDTDRLRADLSRNNVMGSGPDSYYSKTMKKELDSRTAADFANRPGVKWMKNISQAEFQAFLKESKEASKGEVKIKIDSAAPARVTGMKASGMDLTVDTGRTMKGF